MKQYEKVKTEYLCYLMNRVQIEAEGKHGYLHLCETMMNYMFIPILEMDENRCWECQKLRDDFAEEYGEEAIDILDWYYSEYGTMMELLVVLAEKMQYDLADSQYEAGTGKWFREMLQNSGLIGCENGCYERAGYDLEVIDILDMINYRKFGWDGEGGLFPLKAPKRDQRDTELIAQMNDYIEENYDIC